MEITRLTGALIGILLIYALVSAHARPQFQDDVAVADGFVFDGPADRSDVSNRNFGNARRPTNRRNMGRPTRNRGIARQTTNQQNTIGTTTTTTTTPSPRIVRCVQNCQATAEYNPVCGSDNIVYANIGRLNCAAGCGHRVTIRSPGQCTSNVRGK